MKYIFECIIPRVDGCNIIHMILSNILGPVYHDNQILLGKKREGQAVLKNISIEVENSKNEFYAQSLFLPFNSSNLYICCAISFICMFPLCACGLMCIYHPCVCHAVSFV